MKVLAFLTFFSLASYGAPVVLGQNAIINPGAEASPGSATGDDILAAPGWTSSGGFTVVVYGAVDAPLPAGVPGFGSNFFSGGPGFVTSTGLETIDVSNLASGIDAGHISYSLSGWFGGYLTQPDNATLTATFLDGSSSTISTKTVGGVNAAQRNQQTVLVYSGAAGFIPAGTRSVLINLQMNRLQYSYNDGYADNLSFIASDTPEPGTWTMLGIGGALVFARKRLTGTPSRGR